MTRRPSWRRLSLFILAAALLSGVAGAPSIAAPSHAAAAAPVKTYVAMGDSYAAGYGIGTSTGVPVPGCAQSTQNYPHQLASRLGAQLTDVSCSGAVTANLDTTPQQTSSGTAPLQDRALSSTTDLVTLTIGGNDLGFSAIGEYCAAKAATGPLLLHPELNCKAKYAPGGQDTLALKVKNVVAPAVARTLADIKRRAPHASIVVLDYPAISTTKATAPAPATYPASCFSAALEPSSFPFTATDTIYLAQVQADLNAAIKATAVAGGATFVETYPASLTHSACAGTKTPWMNGITVDLSTFAPAAGSLHPNLAGATAMTTAVEPAAEKAFSAIPSGTTSTSHSAAVPTWVIAIVVLVVLGSVFAATFWIRHARAT